jgi:hypothetical protein
LPPTGMTDGTVLSTIASIRSGVDIEEVVGDQTIAFQAALSPRLCHASGSPELGAQTTRNRLRNGDLRTAKYLLALECLLICLVAGFVGLAIFATASQKRAKWFAMSGYFSFRQRGSHLAAGARSCRVHRPVLGNARPKYRPPARPAFPDALGTRSLAKAIVQVLRPSGGAFLRAEGRPEIVGAGRGFALPGWIR